MSVYIVNTNIGAFLAASKFFNQKIWTGDQQLIKGLKSMGYSEIITTNELLMVRLEMRKGQ